MFGDIAPGFAGVPHFLGMKVEFVGSIHVVIQMRPMPVNLQGR